MVNNLKKILLSKSEAMKAQIDATKAKFELEEAKKQEKIENYEREDSLSSILSIRLNSDFLNNNIDEEIDEKRQILDEKTQKQIEKIRNINQQAIDKMSIKKE